MVLEIKDDIAALVSWINSQAPSLYIFVDGCPGAGKTHLLQRLGNAGIHGIDVDQFIIQDQKCYVDALRKDELRAALSTHDKQRVVLACVCARRVSDVLELDVARHIYVIRTSELGVDEYSRAHEVETAGSVPLDIDLPQAGELESEVIAYHQNYRPKSRADVIYRNTRPDVVAG